MKRKETTSRGGNPFVRLAYIYIGSSDFEKDLDFYGKKLGARLVWNRRAFGARVAAFDLCGEPYLLIADHVKAPSKRLIYEVEDLDEAVEALKARGWRKEGGSFEVPDGPCVNFSDASGNSYSILQMSRPHVLEERNEAGGEE